MVNVFKNIIRAVDLAKTLLFYKRGVSKLFEVPLKEINSIYDGLYASKFFGDIKKNVNIPPLRYYLSMLSPFRVPLLYLTCRIMKPEIVVETGVKDGFSSSFILFALETNKIGKLYSIDLPNSQGQELEAGRATGWVVPEGLKHRWSLILGSSQDKLPGLLNKLDKIDIFFHDSDHSYQNMMFEFNTVHNYLNNRGLLISDDITENNSFRDFYIVNCYSHLELFKLGIIIKNVK